MLRTEGRVMRSVVIGTAIGIGIDIAVVAQTAREQSDED